MTLEQISQNLQDRKDFFYYIIFLRKQIMDIFQDIKSGKDGLNIKNIDYINDIIKPLKKEYLLSNEQQLYYKTKYENYIKEYNKHKNNGGNHSKTNKIKSLKHNKTTKVR